jgi:hypothetical protein
MKTLCDALLEKGIITDEQARTAEAFKRLKGYSITKAEDVVRYKELLEKENKNNC